MMIVTGMLTALSRLMGGVATMTVGWVVVLLFGRLPEEKLTLLAFIALGSFSDACMTRTKEAEEIEDTSVDEKLGKLVIPYGDWETLSRLRLQAERGQLPGVEA